MGSAFRLRVDGVYAQVVELLHRLGSAEHLVHTLCAAAHEEVVNLLVELLGIGEHAVVGCFHVETEDGPAEGAHVGELVKVGKHHVEGLVAAPRQSCHSTVLTVGEGPEVGIDIGNEVVEQYGVESIAVVVGATATEVLWWSLDVAALHHHNHRYGLAVGNGVVHDVLHVALLRPACLVLTHTVLQVEHGIAFLLHLLQLILGGGVDHGMAPCFRRLRPVVDAAYLTVGDTLLRTVVVALGTLGNLDAASLAVAAEECLRRWVDEVHATYINKIIMETYHQRVGDSHPAALAVALHVVFLVADVEHHFPGLWSLHVEVGATLFVYLREVVAGNGGLGKEGVGGNLEGPGHLKLRTLGLIAQETGHGLAISATQFTVACGIEVQTVGTVRAAVGRDDLAGVDGLWQFVDLLVAADANTLSVGLYHATHIEVHLLGLEFQVTE